MSASVITPEDKSLRIADVGTWIRPRIFYYDENGVKQPEDLSSASEMKIFFKKPDGTVLEKDAVHYTDGTDGKIQYQIISGDLDVPGKWSYQARVVTPGGTWSSALGQFRTKENLWT